MLACRSGDFVQHRLEPFLEFAAKFRARDQRAHVQREQLLVLQRFRHVAIDDAQRQAFDDGGLADAGFADQHGIVLGAARQHLDRAADFLVAADHGIELALPRRLGEIPRIFLQGVIAVFRRSAVGLAALAQILDGGVQRLRGYARVGENARRVGALLQRQGEKQPLDRDEGIARLLRDLLGVVEVPRSGGREIKLARAGTRDLGKFRQSRFGLEQGLARASARTVDQTRREPFLVVEQNFQNMFGGELLMSLAGRQRLRRLNEAARALRVFLDIHEMLPRPEGGPNSGAPRLITLAPFGGLKRDMGKGFSKTKGAPQSAAPWLSLHQRRPTHYKSCEVSQYHRLLDSHPPA